VLRLVCASANRDKVAEIAAILGAEGSIELLARPSHVPEVVEDSGTLEGNARLKAAAIARAAGIPAVADDTGLEVDALGGAPGVDTAYYAGPYATHAENRAKLLDALDGTPPAHRTARFRTVAMVVWPDGTERLAHGVCEGSIAEHERGGRGWGFDPLFIPTGDTRTFSEMTEAEKHDVGHRGRAFRALLAALSENHPS
jgi:XTP/dITP diphosphohydrolase